MRIDRMLCTRLFTGGVVGVALLLALGWRADAGWFRKCIHGDCAQQDVVRLPAQEIRVETTRPRVIVHETAVRERVHGGRAVAPVVPFMAAPPVVATFYTPVVPIPETRFQETRIQETRISEGSAAFRAAQDLELQAMEAAKLRAAQRAELFHTDRLYQRLASSLCGPGQEGGGSAADLANLKAAIDQLARRLENVERLVITHDNALKDLVKPAPK
jgi:hypothetical protein